MYIIPKFYAVLYCRDSEGHHFSRVVFFTTGKSRSKFVSQYKFARAVKSDHMRFANHLGKLKPFGAEYWGVTTKGIEKYLPEYPDMQRVIRAKKYSDVDKLVGFNPEAPI
jgi:hypothetical protein